MGLSSFLARIALTAALAGLSFACDDLPDIEENVCGNKLVEPAAREVCDGFAEAASGGELPTSCAEPGARFQCQYIHDAEHDCPQGYGPGLDGLCRQGTAQFSSALSHTDFTGSHSLVRDFDGDGRVDLLTSTPLGDEAKVTYLGGGAEPRGEAVITLGDALQQPVAGSFGSDKSADIVAPGAAGLLVLQGQPGSTFQAKGYAPTSFESDVVPIAVPVNAFDTDAILAALYVGVSMPGAIAETDGGLALVGGYEPASVVGFIPNASLDQVIGAITMDLDPGMPLLGISNEVVVALREKPGSPGRVVAITPHIEAARRRSFTYTPTRALLYGPFKVGTRVGIGVGSTSSRYAQLLTLATDDLEMQELLLGENEPSAGLLAMGSYESAFGPVVFAVLPYQVAVDIGLGCAESCFTTVATTTSVYPWTVAAFDEPSGIVVAGSAFTTGLDVLRYNPGALFLNAALLSTDAPVQTLDAADFDGDIALDFLVGTRTKKPGCDDDTRLSIAWGEPLGYPTQPVAVGDFPALDRIATGNFPRALQLDSIDDFVVTAECDGAHRAGIFSGDASRQLRAPFPLTDPLPPYFFGAQNFGAAALALHDVGSPGDPAVDGVDDVLALVGAPPEIGVRPIFADQLADLTVGSELWPITELADPVVHGGALGSARILAADADEDGADELYVVMNVPQNIDGKIADYQPTIWRAVPSGGTMVLEEVARAAGGVSFDVGENEGEITNASAFFYGSAMLTELAFADIDGDGRRDIVVRVALPGIVGLAQSESTTFAFASNESGTYDEMPLELPDGVQGIAGVEGKVPGMALAVATADDVLLCASEGGFACVSTGIVAETANVGLAVADFDGDGVDDVAVSREDGTSFYRQLTAQDGSQNGE